jgi:hypothetical protein
MTLVIAVALTLGAVSNASRAQDDATQTPTMAAAGGPPPVAHPVALHQGTCQQPVAEPAFDLGTAGPPTDEAGQVIPAQGVQTGPPLLEAVADGLEFNLGDTLVSGQPYVVLVHESAQNYTTLLACGELAGPFTDDNLAVALRPINNAGFAGVATFSGGGDTTSSLVYLITDLLALSGGETSGTPQPQATPAGAEATFPPTPSPSPMPTETPAQTPTVVVEVTVTPPA